MYHVLSSDRGIQGTSCQSLLAILPSTWRSGKSALWPLGCLLRSWNEDIWSSKTTSGNDCWPFLSDIRRTAFADGHLRDWLSLLSSLRIKTKELYLHSRVNQSPRSFQRPREYTVSPTPVLCLPRPGWNRLSTMAILRHE